MNNSKNLLPLARASYREFSKSAGRSSDAKLRAIQQKMGLPNNIPVYLKGGFGDKVLYGTTILLTTVGLGMSAEVCYKLTYGIKD